MKNEKEELGLKLGSKEESIFTELKEMTEKLLEEQEKSMIANKAIIAMCEDKIRQEQEKFK